MNKEKMNRCEQCGVLYDGDFRCYFVGTEIIFPLCDFCCGDPNNKYGDRDYDGRF
jgi:hypothetical protein